MPEHEILSECEGRMSALETQYKDIKETLVEIKDICKNVPTKGDIDNLFSFAKSNSHRINDLESWQNKVIGAGIVGWAVLGYLCWVIWDVVKGKIA